MGLEPMTLRLKVWCSTDWANRAAHKQLYGKERVHYMNSCQTGFFFEAKVSVPSLIFLIFSDSFL